MEEEQEYNNTKQYKDIMMRTKKAEIRIPEAAIDELAEYLPTIEEVLREMKTNNIIMIENLVKPDKDAPFETLGEFLERRYNYEGKGYTAQMERERITEEFNNETQEEYYPFPIEGDNWTWDKEEQTTITQEELEETERGEKTKWHNQSKKQK